MVEEKGQRRNVLCCSSKLWTTAIAIFQILGCSIGLTGTILYIFSGSELNVATEETKSQDAHSTVLLNDATTSGATGSSLAGDASFTNPATALHIYKIRITSTSSLNSASITLAAFLVITLIHGIERGIVLLLGVQQEKTCVLKIWMVLMLTDIVLNAVGFITLLVTTMDEDFYMPSTVFIIAIFFNLFFIYVVNEFKIKLQLKNIDRKFDEYLHARSGDPHHRFANDYDIKL